MSAAELKSILEDAVEATRFSMAGVEEGALAAAGGTPLSCYPVLRRSLDARTVSHVVRGLLRSSFFIELVKKPKIETTKYEVRWGDRVADDDPRYASFDDCLAVLDVLATDLTHRLGGGTAEGLLRLFAAHSLVPYELPLGYRERRNDTWIHRADNVRWTDGDEVPAKVVRLRSELADLDDERLRRTFRAAYQKIEVKSYLTDRVLTGAHKTNREKRWETHPMSVHFGRRIVCMGIEYKLVTQVTEFEDFPTGLRDQLLAEGLIPDGATPYQCPITLEPMSFAVLQGDLLNPTQGTSHFHVGHLNPLKSDVDAEDALRGHVAQNIGWISSEGNRIQGHHSLAETRANIKRIAARYARAGL